MSGDSLSGRDGREDVPRRRRSNGLEIGDEVDAPGRPGSGKRWRCNLDERDGLTIRSEGTRSDREIGTETKQ